MIKELYNKYKELILYIFVGGLTTIVNWGSYALCTKLIPVTNTERLVLYSNIAAWIIAVIFAYITNKCWVFESKTDTLSDMFREFVSFIGARILTGVMEIFGVPFLVMLGLDQTLFGVEGFLAKIILSIISTILNYVFSKLFIFKKGAVEK